MAKAYNKPVINVENFMANEFFAACGDSGVSAYNFTCDAPGGDLYYFPNSDGKIDGIHTGTGRAEKLGSYHPCNEKHSAATTDSYYDGFVDYGGAGIGGWRPNGKYDKGEEVIVWRGTNGNNGHATKQLDMDKWETAKS